ncbi:MAG: dihydroorotate dehydrogenase [Candidatus Micrarchaeia archaeon]
MPELSVNLGKLKLENPTILASGILGTTKPLLLKIANSGAGAVTSKSISIEERKGHNSPIIAEFSSGLLNAVGYKNPGIDKAIEEFSGWSSKIPLIISIVGKDAEEFKILAKKINQINCTALEIVLSCPHTPGFGTLAGQNKPDITYEITKKVRENTSLPLIVKLSPNSPELSKTAKKAEQAGADIINMGNSAGPGMIIDIERKKPVLHFGFGGISGPAIKPLSIRCVYDIYKSVEIPIIGTGGITNGKDAIEILMAGASAVGIGTAVYYRGIDVFSKINSEISDWMKKHNYKSIDELVGAVHV